MSAYIVADKTINNIVNWLRREMNELYCIPPKLKKLGIDTTAAGWSEDLGRAMFQLNITAVEARYGNGEAVRFRKLDYRYDETEPVPLVQVLKSLRCWLYQCLEGDIPESALYKLFYRDVRPYLMGKIIDTLPEYNEAEWG